MLDLCGAGSIAFGFRQELELLFIAGVDIVFVLMGILGPSNIATGMVQVMASHGSIRCDLSSRQQRAVRAISKKQPSCLYKG